MASPSAPALSFVYGNDRSNPIPPQDTVRHCQMNNITKLWLSKADLGNRDILDALRNTNIKVIIPVDNSHLNVFAKNPQEAALWVGNFILRYWPHVEFQYICVGQDVLLLDESESLHQAMININDAIQQDPRTKGKIKVSTTIGIHDLENYDVTNPPSQCIFRNSVGVILAPIIDFLISNEAPLFVNVYPLPYRFHSHHNLDLAHYLFTATTPLVTDGNYIYKYVFDSMVDAFDSAIYALKKRHVNLIVAATGWPHNGEFEATIENAQTYNDNLIQHVMNGTPKLPGRLETYILGMYDEDGMTMNQWSRYYGVFHENGSAYYNFPYAT
ncbi:putative glucan endo-1,3-beta-glucosidase BG1 [Tasmannia lanceolata]|uniref:putative glucan endo-1,3-beta-glucosidase BG1 n=1 Tax=Tasmannia lanceolata TaxID=3420 RepID=UPI004064C66F